MPRTRLEMRVGTEWVPITEDAYTRDPITITRGSQSEGQPGPSECRLTLNNKDGRFSPRNPRSPYFGLIGRNTPVRLWVQGPGPYLWVGGAGDRAHVAAGPELAVAGDLDLRVEVALDRLPNRSGVNAPQVTELMSRWDANGRMWALQLDNYGRPGLAWSQTGSDVGEGIATAPLPYAAGTRFALRAVLDVDNGAGGHAVTFYTAPSLAGPWQQLGEVRTGAGTTGINTTGAVLLELGDSSALGVAPGAGRWYRAQVLNGIDGPAVAAADFTTLPPGTRSFTDAAGRDWQLDGAAEVTDFYRRYVGEAASWPSRWATSGTDVWVPLEVAGVLRRLGQGNKPVQSTLRRFIPSHDGLLAYWPMEDGPTATRAASAMDGGTPLTASGITFAAAEDLPSSAALPTLGDAARIRAPLPRLPADATGWRVECVYRLDAIPTGTQKPMLAVTTTGGGISRVIGSYSAAGLQIEVYDDDGALAGGFNSTDPAILAAGAQGWSRLIMRARPGGLGTEYWIIVSPIGQNSQLGVFHSRPTLTRPTRIDTAWGSALAGMPLGHITYTAAPDSSVLGGGEGAADAAYHGETTTARIRRFAREENLPISPTGGPADGTPMGPQRIAAAMEVIQDAADVDGGTLAELRDVLGLQYRTRRTLYNQPAALVLDYRAGDIAPPLEPVDDDQHVRNDRTVTRTDGGSGRAVLESGPLSTAPPPAGVGVYDDSVTLNLATDDQTDEHAWWRLHLGTWDEARYSTVTLRLHTAPRLIPGVLSLDVGDVVEIRNLPEWMPPGPVRLIVEGYSETVLPHTWEIALTCTPAGPWTVATLDPAALGHIDGDTSTLAGAVAEDATAVPIATSAGPLWSVVDGPFDVTAGGEVMTVTALAGSSSPQTATVVRAVNGIRKPHPPGTAVRLAQPAVVAL
ncbi:hypothetical protein OG946_20140 [Streptomyces sp. NBC_01808]|uniref:hypothetical protein n=1 Tax=Streptomyces sp. NBC_01808 TaxID=2975947 RepID=UPI002DDAD1C0|nr:hypothetical protein [Streptomyces sp. NBC_01808]WSA39466.1 hypothetical protein OG946_20140 [Streptomyces sp. NBC_01808]